MNLDELRALATYERDGYHVFQNPYAQMAVTLEDAEWLYALVRLVRPVLVLELGTGLGVSARFIAEAMDASGFGRLATIESESQWRAQAADGLLRDQHHVIFDYLRTDPPPDLVFIDSGYDRRADDIREWTSNGYQGLLCVHDAKRDYDLPSTGVYLPGLDGMWLGRAT
jgi:predicted O-methyltransferase YrrM